MIEQEETVQRGNLVVLSENLLQQLDAVRRLIPNLFRRLPQMLVCVIQMYKFQTASDIPFILPIFRHQTKAVGAAAILPSPPAFKIRFFPIGHIQTQHMMVITNADPIGLILPSSQLYTLLQKGIALCALGTYFFSLGNMLSLRHQRNQLDIFSTNAYAMAYGVILLFTAIQASGQTLYWPDNPSFTWATLYLAIPGSVIGFSAYFLLIGRIGTAKAAYSTLLFPLVALSISTVWERYQWYASNIAGLLLIFSGNFLMFAKKPGLR